MSKIRLQAWTTSADSTSTTSSYSTLLDGPCWKSLKNKLSATNVDGVGHLRVVIGKLNDGSQVVGMPPPTSQGGEESDTALVTLTSGETLVADSVAYIPSDLKTDQVAATYAYALTHVHSLLTVVEGVGGSSDKVAAPPQHAVVVGGSEDAVRAAQALQVLGSDVTLVSTQKPKVEYGKKNSHLKSTMKVTDPSMGDLDKGFSEALNTFDALLDTIGDMQDDGNSMKEVKGQEGSPVIRLLREQHKCTTYVSTCSKAQEIIAREGVLWGPGKVKKYHDSLQSASVAQPVPLLAPPVKIGNTVQTLLDAGVLWSSASKGNKGPHIRNWELSRFMESTMWPIDNRGAANIRYGFPVPGGTIFDDEEDDDDEMMIAIQPLRRGMLTVDDDDDDQDEKEEDQKALTASPYVLQVKGVKDLQRIADEKLDCVLFLSAKFCRSCKKMQLPYNRMARLGSESPNETLVFAKGEASGRTGKLLGRALGIDSVPTFVLFKQGERYGKPLSVSKLPSSKLESAIDYLKEGKPWDEEM